MSKNKNVSKAEIYKTSIGKILILNFKLTIKANIPAKSQIISNIHSNVPAINNMSSTFLRTNDFTSTIFHIDTYPEDGVSLVNVTNIIPGEYRGGIVVITK